MTASDRESILSAVDLQLRKAQAALGQRGAPDAVSRGQHHLQQVDELLAQGVGDAVTDIETLQAMLALRNQLGGYLLAGSTLEEVGATPRVVVDVLRRGADALDDLLGQLTSDRS
jgi:hypothetical protein